MATSTTAAADVTGSDLEALALEDIYAAALPPADHLLPPRSLLQDGRAWEQLLVPAEQLAAATSALECFGLAPTRGGGAVPMSAPDCPSVTVLAYPTRTLACTLARTRKP